MSAPTPNLRNTHFQPDAMSRFGNINLFFSNSVLPSKQPFFAWNGSVYRVDIPSCGCLGKSTYSRLPARYHELT